MSIEHPYYPIIYVRGYAMTQSEVNETASDPYMGFNLGSTKIRQNWTGDTERHYFESPLIRLMKDFGYQDAYYDGKQVPESADVPPKSIFIYRFYENASSELGSGEREDIEQYAEGLSRKIKQVREAVCDTPEETDDFRVYLVAHSMGGLICRTLLQNPDVGDDVARNAVAKVFTYATPHNGIDVQVLGNVPDVISWNNMNNFNRDRMTSFLDLDDLEYDPKTGREAANLDGQIDPERFFCLVGTNNRDYEASYGLAKEVVGRMSDGLVRIKNATTYGPPADDGEEEADLVESPRAFVHRSHSGHYGIVNSEEGYQNLRRFLFGDGRVDGVLEVDDLTLPPKIARKKRDGHEIRASYHFEATVRVRGAHWALHERTVDQGSAIFRKYDELMKPGKLELDAPRYPYLFSVYLDSGARVEKRRRSMGFCVDLGVLVPEYEVDGILFDDHYDQGYIYREKINLEAVPPPSTRPDEDWVLKYGFDSRTPDRTSKTAEPEVDEQKQEYTYRIPISKKTRPGLTGTLVLHAQPVNRKP